MSKELCPNCYYYGGVHPRMRVICHRIWTCYVPMRKECKYFKPNTEGRAME